MSLGNFFCAENISAITIVYTILTFKRLQVGRGSGKMGRVISNFIKCPPFFFVVPVLSSPGQTAMKREKQANSENEQRISYPLQVGSSTSGSSPFKREVLSPCSDQPQRGRINKRKNCK